MSEDPCERPVIYLVDRVVEVGTGQTQSMYKRTVDEKGKQCGEKKYLPAFSVQYFNVSAAVFEADLWKKVKNWSLLTNPPR